jgi:membrane-associated protease RseP (regulator of RpoE activity)
MPSLRSIRFFVLALAFCIVIPNTTRAVSTPPLTLAVSGTSYKVTTVAPGTTLEKSGLKIGDLLKSIDGKIITKKNFTLDALQKLLSADPLKAPIKLKVSRKGKGTLSLVINSTSAITSTSSSSSSPAQGKDTLPFNTPRSSILVLGTLSPVVDVCQTAKNTVLLSGQDDSGRDLSEIYAYDMETKTLVATAKKNGTQWLGATSPTKPFYTRWLPRAFTETDKTAVDFSTKHKIGVTKKCDGSPSTLGFSIAPSAITNVRATGPESLKVGAGRGVTIGSFTFTSTKSSPGLKTFLEQVKFTALVTGSVTLSDIRISMQSQGNTYKTECLYNDPPFVTCVVPDYMGEVSGDTTYTLTADIAKTNNRASS